MQAKGTTTMSNMDVAAVRLVERDETPEDVELSDELRVSLAVELSDFGCVRTGQRLPRRSTALDKIYVWFG
jgi:hypothetical protein